MKRRGVVFYITFVVSLTLVLMRCYWLASGENVRQARAVTGGRERELTLYKTKGIIYDENMNPLAGGQRCWYMVVNPRDFDLNQLDLLLSYCEADREEVRKRLTKEAPFVLAAEVRPEAMTGVYITEGVSRYSGVAQHVIGYLDQAGEVGLAGIEKEYDSFLSLFSDDVGVTYSADAVQGALSGLGILREEQTQTENGVVLTLNRDLCEVLEETMADYISSGAAIIMDCNSGALKAVCSSPGYDEQKILDYLESSEGELYNRAFGAQTVGSVFKIVVAACALENGMENYSYTCEGGIKIGEWTFACHQHAGQKELGLKEAFSESCNSYFIALGQLLGYDKIAEMAARFGFGQETEVLGAIKGSAGNFPEENGSLALANLSIGQGALTASPLQIAKMTAVIANGGILPRVSVEKSIYLDGEFYSEEAECGERILDDAVAGKLREYCIYTVEEGTGKNAKPANGSAGGKTASAQTGSTAGGTEKLNVYFTGFYPAEDPQYVITVFAENGVSGGKTCAPVFCEICDFIAENNLTDEETVVY